MDSCGRMIQADSPLDSPSAMERVFLSATSFTAASKLGPPAERSADPVIKDHLQINSLLIKYSEIES